ncbi:MAG TPA: glycosyltransferase [Methylophilaceae bacterium]|jgi:GT2 family glycosyltransferase
MDELAKQRPRVTIVMNARERHALTEVTLAAIVRHTPQPYRLIYTDGQTPDWLWEKLESRAEEWKLELVRHDRPIWPQALRNLVLDSIDTEYMVLIENDVMVSPGWLEPLIACADETNAGLVGPLYLWGDSEAPLVHMAGAYLTMSSTPEGNILTQSHLYENVSYANVAAQLERVQCDNVESHCVLIRTSPLKAMGGFDEHILNAHEHVDVALDFKKQGWGIYIEPTSQVFFMHYAPYRLEDLAVFRWRWNRADVDASIQYFCDKWGVLNHPLAFDNVLNFIDHALIEDIDPIRASAQRKPLLETPMRREELRQSRSDLLDMAAEYGYSPQELAILSNGYRLAQSLTDGGYRPCSRPFINHLVGVASVLIRYGFKLDMVLVGLLHTFYSHGPSHPNGVNAAVDAVATLLGSTDSFIEKRVRSYTLKNGDFTEFLARPTPELLTSEAEIFILAAAVSIEINLSGEVCYSTRSDALSADFNQALAQVCDFLGVNGLSATFSQINRSASVPPELNTKLNQSYRLLSDKKNAVPMSNNLLSAQQKLAATQSSSK